MSLNSNIEWTDATWNPVTGCTEVSPGCDHCYAKTFAERWRGIKGHHYEQGFDLKLWPSRLNYPIDWKKPKHIFVNSMSDLFHRDVPDRFILDVFAVMAQADHHIFQVLTKRPNRLVYMIPKITAELALYSDRVEPWPDHIWMGVSIETLSYHWRIEQLKQVPAAIRFVSAEPLLDSLAGINLEGIHWLIAGGESGHNYRICKPEWVRELRDICQNHQIAFFFKQWGGRTPKAGGRILDNRTWDEYPELNKIAELIEAVI